MEKNNSFTDEDWQHLAEDFSSFEKEMEDKKSIILRKKNWRKSSIFTIYARVFRVVLSKFIKPPDFIDEEEHRRELDELILPSNEEWRHQVYYQLVDLQRLMDRNSEDKEMDSPSKNALEEKKVYKWEPGNVHFPRKPKKGKCEEILSFLSTISSASGSMTEACIEPGWRIRDIILAAKVLQKDDPSPNYVDEAEMRRVFGLVYDVLRYKHILNHALEDVGFWQHYKDLRKREKIVWLLLYDMQGRKFARLGSKLIIAERERAFNLAGLKDVEDCLLETKTRLAASVSRLRIGGSALTLDDLLPSHLKSAEGIYWNEESQIASGWVNSMKIASKEEFIIEMEKLGFHYCISCKETNLDEDNFAFDSLCPKVVSFHEKSREKLATSQLVRKHRFIFLERSLCLGAASLMKAVHSGKLCGPVILTQCIAPRHTAYVASLLADVEDAGRLLAFGTGDQHSEYENYLHHLGITLQQCRIFSEQYVAPPASSELERATIVLATPHCSYTGINDIVDLSVARGGDSALLESLTSDDDELKYPRTLLADQLSTLKHALTKPNIQLLIYEVHSILPSETTEMVNQVVDYANGIAKEKYLKETTIKKKMPKEFGEKSPKIIRPGKRRQSCEPSEAEISQNPEEEQEKEEEISVTTSYPDIKVPDSDIFEVCGINDIYDENCDNLLEHGCFIAFIRRKEMMQFDSLFMIKVAESKGLFGDPNKQPQKKEEIVPIIRQSSAASRKSFKRAKIQIDRIAAPTHSSLLKAQKESHICPRHSQHILNDEDFLLTQVRDTRRGDIRRWWEDSSKYLLHSSQCNSDCKFRRIRTDPQTKKLLFPSHVQNIIYSIENERVEIKK
ncbi:uncharacterized protein LOC122497899 isoform X3 [Leptopilina heterotoma]|nr:uncharacterized protein LOC122497899 isoform X3 [Leptopilina heterotoma]